MGTLHCETSGPQGFAFSSWEEDTPGSCRRGRSHPEGSLGAYDLFFCLASIFSCYPLFRQTHSLGEAVFRLEYFIQENLAWQSDSCVEQLAPCPAWGPLCLCPCQGQDGDALAIKNNVPALTVAKCEETSRGQVVAKAPGNHSSPKASVLLYWVQSCCQEEEAEGHLQPSACLPTQQGP